MIVRKMVEYSIGTHNHCDIENIMFEKEIYGAVESFQCFICEVKKYICCDCLKLSPEQFAKERKMASEPFVIYLSIQNNDVPCELCKTCFWNVANDVVFKHFR